MPAFRIERTPAGRWRLRAAGCCVDPDRIRRDYERAFVEQELGEGGRIVSDGPDGVELIDHRGRLHRLGAHAHVTAPSSPR